MADRTPPVAGPERSRGVVMVITLLAILLIASLLFYVYNVGTSVQGRVVTQHAADAAAIGGASQVARSMNTVAMNNVETAKLLAAINALDSMPLAVDLAVTDDSETELADIDALILVVSSQLQSGVIDQWFRAELLEMIDPDEPGSLIDEREQLRQLDGLFRDQPNLVPEMTWYEAPSGEMGKMHQAMRSMDAHSQAVMATLGETAQAAASRSAQANLGREGEDDGGLLLPALPEVPWQRGVFVDFERPVYYGLLPGYDERLNLDSTGIGLGQVDDPDTKRGPWDALYGWRSTNGRTPGRVLASGVNGFPGPPSRTNASRSAGRPPTEYEVFGPREMMLSSLPRSQYTQISQRSWDIYSFKTGYLWSGGPIRELPYGSDWEIDIERDNERSTDPNSTYAYGLADTNDIRQTLVIICEIKSRVPNERGHPARKGITWNYARGTRVNYLGGWRDPRDGDPPFSVNESQFVNKTTWSKVQDHIWRFSAVYETNPNSDKHGGDPDIGLPPKQIGTDANGNPLYASQEVYWEVDVMYVGVNVGEGVEVTNPWEGFDKDADDAPAPIDLVHEDLPAENDAARQQYLTFLGLARESNRPGFWPSRFQGEVYPYNTALAQAHVFNNHSWDLWTQTWQARLEPIDATRFDDWIAQAEGSAEVVDGSQGFALDAEQIVEMADHLRSIEALAPVMLNH